MLDNNYYEWLELLLEKCVTDKNKLLEKVGEQIQL